MITASPRLRIIGMFLLIACNNNSIKPDDPHAKQTDTSQNKIQDCTLKNTSAVFTVELDATGKESLVKGDSVYLYKNNVEEIISKLNNKYPVKLKKTGLANDTLYVKVLNSTVFTQQLGDTGADWYLASMVYSLTEGEQITYVRIDFEPGDHGGVPGVKSREDYKSIYKICD